MVANTYSKYSEEKSPAVMFGITAALYPMLCDPLITERVQRRTNDRLNPAIKLLDWDNQQLNRQERQV